MAEDAALGAGLVIGAVLGAVLGSVVFATSPDANGTDIRSSVCDEVFHADYVSDVGCVDGDKIVYRFADQVKGK